jgi:hypothetical protein
LRHFAAEAETAEFWGCDIERPSEDSREYAAVRHNIRQLQRELVDELGYQAGQYRLALSNQSADHERQLQERDERIRQYEQSITQYEQSLSWRLTAPLRRLKRALRDR